MVVDVPCVYLVLLGTKELHDYLHSATKLEASLLNGELWASRQIQFRHSTYSIFIIRFGKRGPLPGE